MIAIVEPAKWECGRYTVRRSVRPDNPAFARYMIFRGDKLVGRSFSVPDAGWCESIERIEKTGLYVDKLSTPKRFTYRHK